MRLIAAPSKLVFGRELSLGRAFRTRTYRVRRSALRKDVADSQQSSTLPASRGPPVIRSILLRCGLFSFVSVNAVFAGSIIWSYENWRKSSSLPSKRNFRDRFRRIFQSLVGRPPRSTDIFWGIALINFLVFLGNNSRRGPALLKLFSNSPYGPLPATSMLLSIFSHQMLLHLFVNMYVLHNFSTPMISLLGMEQFFALYVSGGIFASLLSILSKAARRSFVPSIGASGAICAVLGAFCMLEPHAQLCIPFLVNIVPHSFSAGSAGWAILAFEFFGAMLLSARSPIDHAAHLGGLMFGMYYAMEGKDVIWRRRDAVISAWRRLKGEGKRTPTTAPAYCYGRDLGFVFPSCPLDSRLIGKNGRPVAAPFSHCLRMIPISRDIRLYILKLYLLPPV
ncbi:hypothetical protein AAHC03_012924 [Spirometra sp. Aus1]